MEAACATRESVSTSVETSFREDVCLRLLAESQNSDGGWSSYPGSCSATEPTCLAALALSAARDEAVADSVRRGMEWLRRAQLSNGGWAAVAGQKQGCWVTALACVVLRRGGDETGAVPSGLAWLCANWPAEGNLWWRIRAKFSRTSAATVRQDSTLRGWSWTPETASWVEPTAHALLALRAIPAMLHPKNAAGRIELGERMLYNRMCPGGGWNAGNPQVYGVGGMPRIGATAWALLALSEDSERVENQQSLEWLRRQYDSIRGPVSLALAHICLAVYGCAPPRFERDLRQLYSANQFLHSIHAAAWAAMALSAPNPWLWGPRWKGAAHGLDH
jgi:hypothetical protein